MPSVWSKECSCTPYDAFFDLRRPLLILYREQLKRSKLVGGDEDQIRIARPLNVLYRVSAIEQLYDLQGVSFPNHKSLLNCGSDIFSTGRKEAQRSCLLVDFREIGHKKKTILRFIIVQERNH
jgi:hypothetical protein